MTDEQQTASDGAQVLDGIEPPSEDEQLEFLKQKGWPDDSHN